jgi:MFS family permease
MSPARLIAINVLIRIASAATGQILAFLVAERLSERLGAGTGALLVGLLASSFYVTELLGAPIAGRVADKRGQVKVLRWGPAFGFLSTIGAAAASAGHGPILALAAALLAVRVIEGVSAACAVPTTLALLGQATEARAAFRLRLMGAFEIASLVGLIVGYVGAGVAWDAFGGAALLLFATVYGAAWLLTRAEAVGVTVLRRGVTPLRHAIASLVRAPGVLGFIVAWLSVNAVVGVWVQQAPYLMKLPVRSGTQVLVGGYSGTTIGVIFGAWAAIFLLGIALWSFLAPAWPRRRTLLTALGGMLTVVVALTLVNHGASRAVLAVGIAGVLVESGFTPAAFAHMADLTDAHPDVRGMAMGLYSMLLGAGQLAGAVLGSPVAAAWQMDGVLIVTGMLALVAMIAVVRMPRPVRMPSVLEPRPSPSEAK